MPLVTSPAAAARLLIAGLTSGLAATFLLFAPAQATTPAAPGNFTGLGFDACVAPSQKVMDAWNTGSPYSAIGIYVSGSSRYCGDRYQPNLSKAWVARNAAQGWRFLPIHVGRQSPCFMNSSTSRVQKKKMSYSTTVARAQGREDAAETVRALVKFGFPRGSTSYLDLEWYARTSRCDAAVLAFAGGWTDQLHSRGYSSGVYGSGSAAIAVIDAARKAGRKGFTLPDHMWLAWTNKVADTDGGPYLADDGWADHQRIHQFHNGVNQTIGGYRLNLDKNYLDVGAGSVAVKESKPCGVRMSFASYPSLRLGSRGPEVAALQCLLRQQGFKKSVTQTFGTGTSKAIDAFRRKQGWKPVGRTTRPTWTALLAAGTKPRVLKLGSVGQSVWRLQKALTAAGLRLRTTGVYDDRTVAAVRQYGKVHRTSANHTTTPPVWELLQAGRTAP